MLRGRNCEKILGVFCMIDELKSLQKINADLRNIIADTHSLLMDLMERMHNNHISENVKKSSNHETVLEWEVRNKTECPDDMPVWVLVPLDLDSDTYVWDLNIYKLYKQPYIEACGSWNSGLLLKTPPVVIADKSGKPGSNWRPKMCQGKWMIKQ